MNEAMRFGIRDSLGHEIPKDKLDLRVLETEEVLALLRENPLVVITSENNATGKSTFARILRHQILIQNPQFEAFSDCVYMRVEDIELKSIKSERQDRFTTRDKFTYADLRRCQGLIIFDELYPEYLPLVRTFNRARLLLIIQPDFLKGPPFDNKEHEELVRWLNDSQIPVYSLKELG